MQDNPYGIDALWLQGDVVIKSVAIILLIMSLASWSVILLRGWRLWCLRKSPQKLSAFWQTQNFMQALQQLSPADSADPFRRLAAEGKSAIEHHRQHKDKLQADFPPAEWLSSGLRDAIEISTAELQRGLSILASVGATAPFIGLFGTVWGIYHALVSIGVSGQASIDKVAGPVGEALIMTALGLAVAIPAVLGYNALVRGNKRVLAQLSHFARQLHVYFLTGAPPAQHVAAKIHTISENKRAENVV
ncbi:MAG: MotA/TolQ/ExbB proton channel family protein [Gammaproteobacteria bacterium]|nr:MotA/TolQ/ExbB proton channel family protein [Gammaproteobacteria bacterium]